MNDPRASHVVNYLPNCTGYNVWIPYRGYTISLAKDGGDTCACKGEDGPVLFSQPGTCGVAIRHVMDCVDVMIAWENQG